MKKFNEALATFWKSVPSGENTSYPAYLDGHTPDAVSFPFIKFEVGEANGMGTKALYAWAWVKDKKDGTDARGALNDMIDRVSAKLPQEGAMITFTNGYAILDRNDNWVTTQTDPTDSTVIGGRFFYTVRFYYY